MSKLFWMIVGLLGGIMISRNAQEMTNPEVAAVFMAMIVGSGITFFCGYRGKKDAVSMAVATAVATANANSEANARAAASSAINLYLGSQAGISPEHISSIVDHSVDEISHIRSSNAVTFDKEIA